MSEYRVRLVIGAIFVFIFGLDLILYLDSVPGNAISQVVISASNTTHLVPWFGGFLMGFLTAHFWDDYTQPR